VTDYVLECTLFEGGFRPYFTDTQPTYDVSPAGRFLMIEPNESSSPPTLVVVKNWFEELRQRVPVR
jgi:hypothetical protein